MQITAPTQNATGEYASPVQPSATKIVQVRISVAMVMPEIGLDEEPMRPVIRDDTVTKKNPKMTMSAEASEVPLRRHPGAAARKMASASEPSKHHGQRQVALGAALPAAPPSPSPSRCRGSDETIVGSVRASVISPEASTAPAPV